MTEKTDFTYLKKYGLYVIIAAVGVISIYFIFSGGGKSKNENYTVTDLNTSMPTANRKDLVNDKMQIYYNSERQEEKENRIYNEDFHKWSFKILPYAKHLHLAGANGIDDEGLSLKESPKMFEFLKFLLKNSNEKRSFIVETWQGHLNIGDGFVNDLDYLEKLS